MDKIYEFTFTSTNGTKSKSRIPCEDFQSINSIRDDAMRHADISSVDYKLLKKYYPVIKVPSNNRPKWIEGARTLCFVYSKHHGNFILEGYLGDVKKYLKDNYTKYLCYYSMWSKGNHRGYWTFWKDRDVTISGPSKYRKTWKYTITSYEPRYSFNQDIKIRAELYFKRMPNRWIPEFDKL